MSTADVNDLLHGLTSCHELGAIGGHFNLALAWTRPGTRGLVEKMEDTSSRMASNYVMH